MKFLKSSLLVLLVSALSCLSCKKDKTLSMSALNVVNANANTSAILVYLTESPQGFYRNQSPVGYGSSLEYSPVAGDNPIAIYNSADTVQPLIKGNLNLSPGGIYSLFVAGPPKQTDTVFMQDILPDNPGNTASLRIINLSFDSQQMSINLEGNDPSQAEFSNLAYKQITGFKSYDASIAGGNYTFELWNQATGDLLTTFSWSYIAGKSNTIVISGSIDPASATPLNVFQVNNF